MTTPKSFKKSNKEKEIRACKRGTAKQAIGIIEKNTDTFILTYGQFSLIDALMVILDQTGPAHVAISTWTAAHAHLDKSQELMENSEILSLKMIVDRSFKTRQPGYFAHMIKLFGVDCVREMRTHAKFITVRNDKFKIVARTSMNLNENPRLENIEISENKEFADFFTNIVNDIFLEIDPSENKSDMLELSSLPENPKFKMVSGDYIKRQNLKEARYTHELREHKKS